MRKMKLPGFTAAAALLVVGDHYQTVSNYEGLEGADRFRPVAGDALPPRPELYLPVYLLHRHNKKSRSIRFTDYNLHRRLDLRSSAVTKNARGSFSNSSHARAATPWEVRASVAGRQPLRPKTSRKGV